MSFMATAVAVTAATGIYSAYSGYQAAGVEADNIKAQAKQDKMDMESQMALDSAEESRVASAERKENRRLRAIQEGAYAKSGVLMEGSAADVLTQQRATDEANVQNIHIGRGNQRAQDTHKMNRDYESSLYMADSVKSAAKTQLVTSLLSTAGSVGMGAASMWTPKGPVGATAFQAPKPLSLPSSSIGSASPIGSSFGSSFGASSFNPNKIGQYGKANPFFK